MRRWFLSICMALGLFVGLSGWLLPAASAQDEEEEIIYEDVTDEEATQPAEEGAEEEVWEEYIEEPQSAAPAPTPAPAAPTMAPTPAPQAEPEDEVVVEEEEEYLPEPEFEAQPAKPAPTPETKQQTLPPVIEEEMEEEATSEEEEISTEDFGAIEEEAPAAEEKGPEVEYEDEFGEEYWEEAPEAAQEMAEIETALEESQKIPTVLTSLEDCKRVALLNDPRIQVAIREVRYERYKVLQAERDFLPALKGNWEKQEGETDTSGGGSAGGGGNYNGLKYGLETTQVVFQGGKLTYTLKQAKTDLNVARKKYEQAKQEAIYKVEKAYYELVKTQMVFEIQADLSKAAESALSFSREAYRQGLNSYQEFLNVQSQTDHTYYQLLSSQQDIALAEVELRKACNVDTSIGVQINAVLTFTDFDFNYSLDECLSLGFKNRPDLAVNELTTLSDLYGIKISMAEDQPKIEFVGSVGKNGQSQTGEGLNLSDEWSVKLQATWIVGANSAQYSWEKKKSVPTKYGAQDNTKGSKTQSVSLAFFDKIENFANVAKSKVDKATSEADLVELRQNVTKEVEENYFNYQKAMTMVTASLSMIKFREKDLEINRAKQMMNEIPLSQVLQSELQLGEERVNYVQALSDYYTSISGLFKAMGLSK
ncbi:MAG: TolC family protein [candidate division FCPU426 bacterium]